MDKAKDRLCKDHFSGCQAPIYLRDSPHLRGNSNRIVPNHESAAEVNVAIVFGHAAPRMGALWRTTFEGCRRLDGG